MNDRELMELAAKAAGIDFVWLNEHGRPAGYQNTIWLKSGGVWNPLTDDGDALRLAVKLGLMIDVAEEATGAQALNVAWCSELHNGDPYAATRLAIVRAAAEIGKQT